MEHSTLLKERKPSPPAMDQAMQLDMKPDVDMDAKQVRSIKKAAIMSAVVPGLGQFYNSQVSKGLLIFLFFSLSVGSVFFYTFILICTFMTELLHKFAIATFKGAFTLLRSPVDNCTDPSSALCSTKDLIANNFANELEILQTSIDNFFSHLMEFPLPPLIHTAWKFFDLLLLDHFFIVAVLFIFFFTITFTYQIFDAYSIAKKINTGEYKVLRSRRRQLVLIFTLNFLPYFLLLLPIPYVSAFVDVCFASSNTITQLVENVESKEKTSITTSISPKQIVWEQLKALIISRTLEFVQYSVIMISLVVYVVWYAVLIGLWIAGFVV